MDSFANVIESWHDFYMMMGAAATTLVGLLFVSMSINLDLITHENNADLRELAIQTFTNFLNIIMLSVLFLIPNQDRFGLGIPLIGICGGGFYATLNQFLKTCKVINREWDKGDMTRRFAAPAICYLATIIVAVFVLLGRTGSLYWLVPIMITLIIGASINSWDLLLQLGQPRIEK